MSRMTRMAVRISIVFALCTLLLAVVAANAYAETATGNQNLLDPPWMNHAAQPWEAINILTFGTEVYIDIPEADIWYDPWEWVC